MSSKQQTIKEEGDKTSVDRGKVYAKLEPSKKPTFLETYLNVKKDGHGKTLKPLLAEYAREMQERTSPGVESEERLFYSAKLLSLSGISWQDCGGACGSTVGTREAPTRTARITKRLNAARRC